MSRHPETSGGAAVLRDARQAGAARAVGRPAAANAAGGASAAVAGALSRMLAAEAAPAPVDEAVLDRAREEGRQAGRQEARAEIQRDNTHAGFEEGLQRGLSEGRAAGEAEAQRRFALAQEHAADRLRRLDELHGAWSTQLAAHLAARLSAAEDDMIALCHAAVCRILGDALATRAGAAQAVRTGIEQWLRASEQQSRDGMVVHVHPADLDAMKSDDVFARWLVQQGLRGVQWQAHEDVRLGGCIVHGQDGDLDARLETQLEILADQLRRSRGERGAE
jgi:flagellar assembly protein FliH